MIDNIKSFFREKFSPLKKWRFLPGILNKNERVVFLVAFSVFAVSLIAFPLSIYFSKTEKIPTFGGIYSEGMIGYPRFINPIYSSTSDIDRDITSLLFSGLMKYDFSEGFIPNMIEEIDDNGTFLKIKIREDLRWSDGEKITATDIVFTVRVIQDPEYRSPLRPDWIGIKVEEISEFEVGFTLERPSVAFLNKLSLKIIPRHIWKDVPVQNFPLSRYNLDPVGSGPYRMKESREDSEGNIKELVMEPNPYYHGQSPYIEEISFFFFENKEDILSAAQRGDIRGLSAISPKNYRDIINRTGFKGYRFQMPRYFGLFFNLESEKVTNKNLRIALNLAVDKNAVIDSVLAGRGQRIDSPVLSAIYGLNIESFSEFDPEKSKEILDNLGLIEGEDGFRFKTIRERTLLDFQSDLRAGSQGEGVRNLQRCLIFISEEDPDIFPNGSITGFYSQETREAVTRLQEKYREEILDPSGFSQGTGMVAESTRAKLNELCAEIPGETVEIKLVITTIDQTLMIETAEMIRSQWEAVGIRTEIEIYDRISLERDVIKPRDYDILLFGKAFEAIPDLFPFWHSSQKSEFGLNLTMYDNEEADSILEELREERNTDQRILMMEELQNIITGETPAIFLYNPDYLYFISPRVSGISPGRIINPSDRFSGIESWYIKTKRAIKRK